MPAGVVGGVDGPMSVPMTTEAPVTELPPGALPPGTVPTPAPVEESVPLDVAPVPNPAPPVPAPSLEDAADPN